MTAVQPTGVMSGTSWVPSMMLLGEGGSVEASPSCMPACSSKVREAPTWVPGCSVPGESTHGGPTGHEGTKDNACTRVRTRGLC
eukprot:6994621-Alexandrium_andersonii.AAC.1